MTTTEYERSVLRSWNHTLSYNDQLLNAALGLGEVGELQNLIKKMLFHRDSRVNSESLLDELGDAEYYFTILRLKLGFTEDQVRIYNKEKLERRYPVAFKEGGGIR